MGYVLAASLAALLVTYVGYPLAMAVLGQLRARPVRTDPLLRPSLSVLIAARDEAAVIGRKLRSVLAQGYPAERLEVLVIDDGSTDDTAAVIAREISDPRVRLLRLAAPSGKAAAIDAGASAAAGEILVLTDARQALEPDALAALVAPFLDEEVGAVSGELSLRRDGSALGLYRRLDDRLRRVEADSGSSVGVTGALWALRRDLYQSLPSGLILDDLALPLLVARAGYRVVVASEARVVDDASPDPDRELRRRTRTLAGNLQLLRFYPWLLSPTTNPLFVRLVGHKLLRVVAPIPLLLALVSNLLLALRPVAVGALPVYRWLLAAQLLAWALAALPPRLSLPAPISTIARGCRAFALLHVAATLAMWRFVRGEERSLWRDGPAPRGPSDAEVAARGERGVGDGAANEAPEGPSSTKRSPA